MRAHAEPATRGRSDAHRRRRDHPWPQPLPAALFDQPERRDPQPYVQVAPLLIAEIVVDQAYDRGRYRHPVRDLRIRADLGRRGESARRPGFPDQNQRRWFRHEPATASASYVAYQV